MSTRDKSSPIGSSHGEEMAGNAASNHAYREALEELGPGEQLARIILHKRMALGLSQVEVAERMGTTASVISRLESGNHSITMTTLQRIAAALDSRLVVGFAQEEDLEAIKHRSDSPELAAV